MYPMSMIRLHRVTCICVNRARFDRSMLNDCFLSFDLYRVLPAVTHFCSRERKRRQCYPLFLVIIIVSGVHSRWLHWRTTAHRERTSPTSIPNEPFYGFMHQYCGDCASLSIVDLLYFELSVLRSFYHGFRSANPWSGIWHGSKWIASLIWNVQPSNHQTCMIASQNRRKQTQRLKIQEQMVTQDTPHRM